MVPSSVWSVGTRRLALNRKLIVYFCDRPYQISRVNSTLLMMWIGIQRHINWPGMYTFWLAFANTATHKEGILTSYSAALQPLSGKVYTSYSTKVCEPPSQGWIQETRWLTMDKWTVGISHFLRSLRARISRLRTCELLIHADRGEGDSWYGKLGSLERRHDDNCRRCTFGETTWWVQIIVLILS